MMKVIIYTNLEGILVVVNLPGTGAAIEKKAWDALPSEAINPRFVDESEIPINRTFRNAWRDTGATVDHDMMKARELHKNRLRELREQKFVLINRAQSTALSKGDAAEAARLETELQKLRDVTANPAIEAAQTVDELRAVWPEVLK